MTETSSPVSNPASLQVPHRLGVVLVGAGAGTRLGADVPKAFVRLGSKTLLEHAISTVLAIDPPGHLVVVAPDSHAAEALTTLENETHNSESSWSTNVALGGAERYHSVRNGLELMPAWVDVVLVHDIARPLTPVTLFESVAHAVRHHRVGAIPILPVVDTVKVVDAEGFVHETLDRSELAYAQTPQGFLREELVASYGGFAGHPTDDAQVMQAAGFQVRTVPGSELAHKLTTPDDLVYLAQLMAQHNESES